MEEITEGFLRLIFGIIRWFVWQIITQILLFNIGRLTCLLITLGRYPKEQSLENDLEKISWIGVLTTLLVWSAIAIYNHYD